MIDWMANNTKGRALLTRLVPKSKPGQDDSLTWELDLVDAVEMVQGEQTSMFPGLEGNLHFIDNKQFSHVNTKVQLVDKGVRLSLANDDGVSIFNDLGGEIRFAQVPVTDKAKTQRVRIVLTEVPLTVSDALCRVLNKNVQVRATRVKEERPKADLKLVDGGEELPEEGALVAGVDDGGQAQIGIVTAAEKGAIQVEDFGDHHVLKSVGTVTEVMSDDDTDVDDHLGRYAAEVEEIGEKPSFAVLMDAIVRCATEDKVAPASATTTYINEAVIDAAVQVHVDRLPEAGNA